MCTWTISPVTDGDAGRGTGLAGGCVSVCTWTISPVTDGDAGRGTGLAGGYGVWLEGVRVRVCVCVCVKGLQNLRLRSCQTSEQRHSSGRCTGA